MRYSSRLHSFGFLIFCLNKTKRNKSAKMPKCFSAFLSIWRCVWRCVGSLFFFRTFIFYTDKWEVYVYVCYVNKHSCICIVFCFRISSSFLFQPLLFPAPIWIHFVQGWVEHSLDTSIIWHCWCCCDLSMKRWWVCAAPISLSRENWCIARARKALASPGNIPRCHLPQL